MRLRAVVGRFWRQRSHPDSGRLVVTRYGSTFVVTPAGFAWRIDPFGRIFSPLDDDGMWSVEELVPREAAVRRDPSLAPYLT